MVTAAAYAELHGEVRLPYDRRCAESATRPGHYALPYQMQCGCSTGGRRVPVNEGERMPCGVVPFSPMLIIYRAESDGDQ